MDSVLTFELFTSLNSHHGSLRTHLPHLDPLNSVSQRSVHPRRVNLVTPESASTDMFARGFAGNVAKNIVVAVGWTDRQTGFTTPAPAMCNPSYWNMQLCDRESIA